MVNAFGILIYGLLMTPKREFFFNESCQLGLTLDIVFAEMDVIDEALHYFKANVFFRTYEIKSDADRVLIYVTLYIQVRSCSVQCYQMVWSKFCQSFHKILPNYLRNLPIA